MKKTTTTIIVTALMTTGIMLLVSSCQHRDYQALRQYYEASEAFMKEIDEDTDGLVLESGSDAGCAYWEARLNVEQLNK